LNVYKILAEAPDPYPLLDVAVVSDIRKAQALGTYPAWLTYNVILQDQLSKVGEREELEAELQKVKIENAELRRKVTDSATLEAAKKRAEDRAEALEQKVLSMDQV
jgi:homeobox protein cut-like